MSPSAEEAETGSWMTPASLPNVTAQLGRLMTDGGRPRRTPARPERGGRPHGEKKETLPRSMGRCSGGEAAETAAPRGPLSFSPVIENHVKGQ